MLRGRPIVLPPELAQLAVRDYDEHPQFRDVDVAESEQHYQEQVQAYRLVQKGA
jgi:hypothetical protein